MATRWQPEEIQFLIDNFSKYSCREMASMLNRDYSSTKRKVKTFVLDIQDDVLPDGFVRVPTAEDYVINEAGTVIRIRTKKEIKPHPNKKGYLQVCLTGHKSYRIHRLVAELFVSNPDQKPQVNHKDGNKANNHYSNLEWVTDQENRLHAIETGLWDNISAKVSQRQTGSGNSCAKLNDSDVLAIYQMLKSGCTVGDIARQYNVNHSNISSIKSGKSWKHLYHYYSEGSTTRTDVRTPQAIGGGNGEYPNSRVVI